MRLMNLVVGAVVVRIVIIMKKERKLMNIKKNRAIILELVKNFQRKLIIIIKKNREWTRKFIGDKSWIKFKFRKFFRGSKTMIL